MGLTKSLNIGLKLASGKYIARMDADDICMHERLYKQVAYLENNPEISVCGTNRYYIVNDKVVKKYNILFEKNGGYSFNVPFKKSIYASLCYV